jgi:hypothetical protein
MTEAESNDWIKNFIKGQDDLMGHAGDVETSHPAVAAAKNVVAPLWRWYSGGERTAGRAIASVGKGRASTIPELLTGIAGQIAISQGVAAAVSYAKTGHTQQQDWTNPMDWFFPKSDDAGGRLGIPGIFLNTAEHVVRLANGDASKIMDQTFGPTLVATARFITGQDWRGKPVHDIAQRVKDFVRDAVVPITGKEAFEGGGLGAAGIRKVPKDIQRDAAK